jgi:rhodanese-related sulfurtransferase
MVAPQDALELVNAGKAVLVDVREEEELQETGTAPQAQFMPTSFIEDCAPEWKAFVAALPKDKEIILFCRSGNRSGRVAMKLAQMGYQTSNMGGFEGWIKAGLSVKKI